MSYICLSTAYLVFRSHVCLLVISALSLLDFVKLFETNNLDVVKTCHRLLIVCCVYVFCFSLLPCMYPRLVQIG